jgi:hypothetical protein
MDLNQILLAEVTVSWWKDALDCLSGFVEVRGEVLGRLRRLHPGLHELHGSQAGGGEEHFGRGVGAVERRHQENRARSACEFARADRRDSRIGRPRTHAGGAQEGRLQNQGKTHRQRERRECGPSLRLSQFCPVKVYSEPNYLLQRAHHGRRRLQALRGRRVQTPDQHVAHHTLHQEGVSWRRRKIFFNVCEGVARGRCSCWTTTVPRRCPVARGSWPRSSKRS